MDDFLRLQGEKRNLTLTVIHTDGEELARDTARAFTDALLAERGEQGKWTFDGISRLNYCKVDVHYITSPAPGAERGGDIDGKQMYLLRCFFSRRRLGQIP